jgi:hypothetical protein
MLSQTRLTEKAKEAVLETIEARGWEMGEVRAKLQKMMAVLENRNRKIAQGWLDALTDI